jgi:alkylation response protein AidB-like acyl-CoA dehydrogenase
MGRHPFALTDEQEALLERAARLGREVFAPMVEDAPPARVNRSLLRALAAHGLLPRLFPREAGGEREDRVSAVDLCLLREGLARACPEAETALALQGLGAYPILLHGAPEVVARYVPPVARGEAVAAFALSEPEAGSDVSAIALEAVPDARGYRLTGEKAWISNAPEADVYTVFARTTPGAGPRGITAFAVPGDAPGLTGEPIELSAPHPIGRLRFEGVPVPADHVLGEVDRGLRVALGTLDLFRASVGAFAVGMARAALDAAVAHARERRAFGRPIAEFQAVGHRLAEAATRVEAARLLVYRAAAAFDAGLRVTRESAMAKLYATEAAQFAIDVAIQVHGARGLVRGHLLERLYRDVRTTRIYEGTSEIQREVIARELLRGADAGGGATRPPSD